MLKAESYIDYLAKIFKKFESISLCPLHLYHESDLCYPTIENERIDPFTADPMLSDICRSGHPLVYDRYDREIYYCSTMLPENFFCVIGPLSLTPLKRERLHTYLHAHHMDSRHNYPIPKVTIPQAYDALNLIRVLADKRDSQTDENELIPDLDTTVNISDSETSAKEIYDIHQYMLESTENERPHFPHQIEAHLLEAVRKGDINLFNHYKAEAYKYSVGDFANTELKIIEYTAVSAVAVMTRTVVQADVPADVAYATSDRMLYRLSQLKTAEEINAFTDNVYVTFINMVKNYKEKESGPLYIRKCKNYIIKHLNTTLTVTEIAEHSGISVSYLSHLFHKYENSTVMSYVQNERIRAASNMLKYSDYSIIRIANYFQFQTQSHFSAVFKKYMKMTPAAYRRKYARE